MATFGKMQLRRFTSNSMNKSSPDYKSSTSPVDITPDVRIIFIIIQFSIQVINSI